MNDKDFKILSVLSKTKNITNAADKLYLTQSALSKRIKAIEDSLNTKIVVRSNNGIEFTESGTLVVEYFDKISNLLNELKVKLQSDSIQPVGIVKTCVSINYSRYKLPSLLNEFHELYSNIGVNINTGQSKDLYDDFKNELFDIAILRGDFPWRDKKYLLHSEAMCLIKPLGKENEDLNCLPYIARSTDLELSSDIDEWLRENKILNVSKSILVDDVFTCVEMVKRGNGWSIVPEICLENFKGYVENIYINGSKLERKTYLLVREAKLKNPAINTFVKFLIENNEQH